VFQGLERVSITSKIKLTSDKDEDKIDELDHSESEISSKTRNKNNTKGKLRDNVQYKYISI
jgi:hypothetical protein